MKQLMITLDDIGGYDLEIVDDDERHELETGKADEWVVKDTPAVRLRDHANDLAVSAMYRHRLELDPTPVEDDGSYQDVDGFTRRVASFAYTITNDYKSA